MARPRISVFIAVSMDGFIARADGGLDWLKRVECPGEDYGYQAFIDTVDTVVIGRETYDAVIGFGEWPFLNKLVTVLTHRPLDPKHGETTYSGAMRPLQENLEEMGARRVYLDGGVVIRQGLTEGVIDDLTLSWIPVLLGSGRPLFATGIPESEWHMVNVRGFPKGLVQATYKRRCATLREDP